MIWISVGLFVTGGVIGYLLSIWFVARDPQIVKLENDEIVVKRPGRGMVMAQVSPDVLRRMIAYQEKDLSEAEIEARFMYPLRGAKVGEKARK